MEKLMDLHMHSYYSDDGEFSPEELVRQCAMSGIRVMSIADHNSVRANDAGRQAEGRNQVCFRHRDRLHVQRCEPSCTGVWI